MEFDTLVEDRQLAKSEEDRHKRIREDLDKRIEAMLLLAGAADGDIRVQSHSWIVQRVTNSGASKLDPRLLLEYGVSADTIAKATVDGKPYSYVLVKQVKA